MRSLAASLIGLLIGPSLAIAQEGGRPPEFYGLVVGVEACEDKEIPACPNARADARVFYDWLIRTAGWRAPNLLLMDGSGGERRQPTRANLEWAVKEWLVEKSKPGDVVLIYWAGQAVPESLPPRSPADAISPIALLPADARLPELGKTGWRLEDSLDPLASAGERTVIVVLDTSPVGRGQIVAADPSRKPSAPAWLARVARWPGVSAWLSASDRPSQDGTRGRPGPFLGAFLEASGGKERPANLTTMLNRLRQNPAIAEDGFRAVGGLSPRLTLWADRARPLAEPAPELVLQRGHADRVTRAIPTPDGAELFTASEDGTLRHWRMADRKVLRARRDHVAGVTSLSLGDDGRFLASGDRRGEVRFWDRDEDLSLRSAGPALHGMPVVAIEAIPGGSSFLSRDEEGVVVLWGLDRLTPSGRKLPLVADAVAVATRPCAWPIALSDGAGTIHLLDAAGEPKHRIQVGGAGRIASLAIAPGAERLAAVVEEEGGKGGTLVVWDAPFREARSRSPLEFVPEQVAFAPDAASLAVLGEQARIARFADAGAPEWFPLERAAGDGPVAGALFSADATFLAFRGKQSGAVELWRIAGAKPAPIALEPAPGDSALSLAFSPDGKALIAGGEDGGLRAWGIPDGRRQFRVPAQRGAIEGLAVAPDGRELIVFTRDFHGLRWDLRDGRGASLLDGRWLHGTFLPDGKVLALSDAPGAGRGDVKIADRQGRVIRVLPRPLSADGARPIQVNFGKVVAAGGRIAAQSMGTPPLACVWDAKTGNVKAAIRPESAPGVVSDLALSADGKQLLLATEQGVVELWDLEAMPPRRLGRLTTEGRPSEQQVLGAAAFRKGHPNQVITGAQGGETLLWDLEAGKVLATLVANREGGVTGLATADDGSWAAAVGPDNQILFWEFGEGDRPRPARFTPAPNHDNVITAIAPLPGGGRLVTAGWDTTVRLWDLSTRALRGTFTATVEVPEGVDPQRPAVFPVEWVAYAPNGVFDASPGGESQVAWRVGHELRPLEQYYEYRGFHADDLGARLVRGEAIAAPEWPKRKPPAVSLDPPAQVMAPARDVEVEIALGNPADVSQLRLYQNGVPIPLRDPTGADLPDKPGGGRIAVKLRLRSGENRLYALASGVGTIDGRSSEITLRYDGPENPARVHVLALGVDDYRSRKLRFAGQDAVAFASWLGTMGVDDRGQPGIIKVLRDDQVSHDSVRNAFLEIRKGVSENPEDKVVVFLAGHAGVLDDRFCLMLKDFPFPEGGPVTVAMRSADLPTRGITGGADRPDVLPYAKVFADLARLGALNRLVVIDACEAEAIKDDPGVKRLQRLLEGGARTARTAYLLAARRGEAAREAPALAHGLFTYTLLKGLGRTDLAVPPELKVFRLRPNADIDGDGAVSTAELRSYADWILPELALQYGELARRGESGEVLPAPAEGTPEPVDLDTEASGSFPLVPLPAAASR